MKTFWKIFFLVLILANQAPAQFVVQDFLPGLSPTQKSTVRYLQNEVTAGKTSEALKVIERNIEQGKAFDPDQQSFLLQNLGIQNQIALQMKNKGLRQKSLNQLKEWAPKIRNQEPLQYMVRIVSESYFDEKNPEPAKDLLQFVIQNKNLPQIVREQALYEMANALRDPYNPGPSLKYIDQLLALPRNEKDTLAGHAIGLKTYLSFYKDPKKTEQSLLEALKIISQQKRPYYSDIANIHQRLAEINFTMANYGEALKHAEKAELFIKKNTNLSATDRSNLIYSRALRSFTLQDLPKAEEDLKKITPLTDDQDIKWEYQARLFSAIRLQGKVEEAKRIYEELKSSPATGANIKIRCAAAFEFSGIEIGLGSPQKAIEMLEETRKSAATKDFPGKQVCLSSLDAQLTFAQSFQSPRAQTEKLLSRFPEFEKNLKALYGDSAMGPHRILYTPWAATLLVLGKYTEALEKTYTIERALKTSSGYYPMHFYAHLEEAMTKILLNHDSEAEKKLKDIQSYLELPISKQARSIQQPQLDLVKAFLKDHKKNPENIRKLLSQDKTHSFRFYILRGKL